MRRLVLLAAALAVLPSAVHAASISGLVYHDADSDGLVTSSSTSSASFASASRSELDAGVVDAPVSLRPCSDPSAVAARGESGVDERIADHSPIYEGGGQYGLDAGTTGGACAVRVSPGGEVLDGGEGCYVTVGSPAGYEITSTFPAARSCDDGGGGGYAPDGASGFASDAARDARAARICPERAAHLRPGLTRLWQQAGRAQPRNHAN